MEKPKSFSLKDRVDEAKVAKRFGVSREEVRDAISAIAGSSIEVSATKRKEDMQQYLRHVYDELAREWSFENMVHMMATAHTEMVARAIAEPLLFGKEGIRALKDVAHLLYPIEKMSVKRQLPAGDTKETLLARITTRLLEDKTVDSGDVIEGDTVSAGVGEGADGSTHEVIVDEPTEGND